MSILPRSASTRLRCGIVEHAKIVSDSFNSTMAFLNRFFRAVKIEQTKAGQPGGDSDVRRLAGHAGPGGFGCCHRVSSFVGVWVHVPSAPMSTTASKRIATELAVTQDDVADTALGQRSEDARRPLDTETRSKRAEDGETRRRKEQTSNPNQLLLLCGQDVAPVARAVEAADAAHGAVDVEEAQRLPDALVWNGARRVDADDQLAQRSRRHVGPIRQEEHVVQARPHDAPFAAVPDPDDRPLECRQNDVVCCRDEQSPAGPHFDRQIPDDDTPVLRRAQGQPLDGEPGSSSSATAMPPAPRAAMVSAVSTSALSRANTAA